MIRLRRGPAPAILTRRFPDGKTERERAILHYTSHWNGKAWTYTRYGEDEVRKELDRLAHGKCAYCESRIHVVTHEDVEHWRPKNSVVRKDGSVLKPGYYWLGAEWSNLLPSCPHCNRRSRKDLNAPDGAMSGKQDLFPVKEETRRWRHADRPFDGEWDAPNREVPLLLDPCSGDDPADYFTVDENGVLHEKHPAGTLENDRARESIAVYGLNRPDLVAERRKEHRRVAYLLRELGRHIQSFDAAADDAARQEARDAARDALDMLAEERSPESPYLFLKLPMIDGFVAAHGRALERLGLG